MKPCCCDEFCESVETTTTLFPACTWRVESPAPFCENSGKLESLASAYEAGCRFIRIRQEVLRSFFNSPPQDLREAGLTSFCSGKRGPVLKLPARRPGLISRSLFIGP